VQQSAVRAKRNQAAPSKIESDRALCAQTVGCIPHNQKLYELAMSILGRDTLIHTPISACHTGAKHGAKASWPNACASAAPQL
jgi:hypothetical protein